MTWIDLWTLNVLNSEQEESRRSMQRPKKSHGNAGPGSSNSD